MKIYVVGGATYYTKFLKNVNLTDVVEDADVVLFTGGEDVSPSMYGCKKHVTTHSNINRDKQEKAIFDKLKPTQICVGCCRGSQMLCVLNGGLLVQNVTNHAVWHTHGITNGEVVYQITSTHHQMQYPYNLNADDYTILFKADENYSDRYQGDKIDNQPIEEFGEPEIVLYHKKGLPKCLAIQGHPEMIPDSPVAEMINNLVTELVDESNN